MLTTHLSRAIKVTTLFAVPLLSLGLAVTPARAFTAIAYAPHSHFHGWSRDKATRSEAEAEAMARCNVSGIDCQPVVYSKNCVALVIDDLYGWAAASGPTEAAAIKKAFRLSKTVGDEKFEIWESLCNTGQD